MSHNIFKGAVFATVLGVAALASCAKQGTVSDPQAGGTAANTANTTVLTQAAQQAQHERATTVTGNVVGHAGNQGSTESAAEPGGPTGGAGEHGVLPREFSPRPINTGDPPPER